MEIDQKIDPKREIELGVRGLSERHPSHALVKNDGKAKLVQKNAPLLKALLGEHSKTPFCSRALSSTMCVWYILSRSIGTSPSISCLITLHMDLLSLL